MSDGVIRGPGFEELYQLFPDPEGSPIAEVIPADQVPSPYFGLLVHSQHMTVTVEDFYGGSVEVRVIASQIAGDTYCRKILLAMEKSKRVVQFGAVRIHLHYCDNRVREAILEQKTPLGRILIEHDVLTKIAPFAFLRVMPNASMCGWFGLAHPETTFGRLGVITCDGKPAIEVLEVLAPISRSE